MTDTKDSDSIKQAIYIKTEYKDTDDHEVKTEIEQWENGIKEEVTESAALKNTENHSTQKTYYVATTNDLSNYHSNTNIINTEEIYIKSEYGEDGEYEEGVVAEDTDRETSSSTQDDSPNALVSINKVKQPTTSKSKTFEPASSLLKNNREHSKQKLLTCEQCNKTFSYSSHFTRHKRLHSGEKPFKCDQCNKVFSLAHHLTNHKILHSGEKPFRCDQCDKAYSHPSALIAHKRTHSGEKPFKCDQCNKAFSYAHHLINHKRIHSGEKPFKCDKCNKAFTQKSHLITHKRLHSGENRYNGNQRNKVSAHSTTLIEHKQLHSGEKS